ncbi:MAG: hypothetical protein J6I45_03835, partial [Clostridia bacterium]|nr:hypothetical protein [Clostridia bacterium]
MNARIDHLKSIIYTKSEDIPAYRSLVEQYYVNETGVSPVMRRANFLTHFAEEIPIVMDNEELICGSMRFWRGRYGPSNKGHIIVDYRMILSCGIECMIERASHHDTEDAAAFVIALNAFSHYIERHADAAEKLYAETKRPELERMAANCHHLTKKPPESFAQAIQLVWFVHLFLHAESLSAAFSFGRFDDYLYPYYKADIESGVLAPEDAEELLAAFWLKCCEGDESQNLTVGGDRENPLTFLCMEVAAALKVQQPSLSVRICEKSSDALWKQMLSLIKVGIGMPAIFCDDVIIRSLKNLGIADRDAENYAIVGCYEANPDGKTYGTTANAGRFFLHDVLLAFLAREKAYADFDDFYRSFKDFFRSMYSTQIVNGFRAHWKHIREHLPSPFESACMGRCLDSGIAAERSGCEYTMCGINILGIGTLIDSLYVMKKLIFEEKTIDYTAFIKQVQENFPDRALAETCRNYPGKYGTDSPETNEMAADLSNFIADLIAENEIYEGVIPYAGLFVFMLDIRSDNYPATPDGRLQGDRISYGISASDLCVGKTVTSVMNSASHIANDRFADGNPLMFTLNERELAGERGDMLLKSLIKGYFAGGGFHLQFNVTDTKRMKAAKENPNEHRDLIIRISGYSEYFTKLDE